MEPYIDFSNWLNNHLSKKLPDNIVAFNFNLYEGSKQTYDVELVGCNTFDKSSGDWACNEVFSTRENLFFVPRTTDIAKWNQGLSFITSLVEKYLREGKYADKLKSYTAVCIGFTDGDINILHHLE